MTRKVLILAVVAMLLPAATAMAFHPNPDCDRCHVPHQSKTDQGAMGMPLWNPETATDEVSLTVYDSWYMQAAPGDPTGSTLLCLSCHDGTGGLGIVHDGGEQGDLSRSHPIEFVYDGALAALDQELVDPDTQGSSTLVGGKGTISEDLLFGDGGKMKCTSCHEIHENGLHDSVFDEGTRFEVTMDMPHLQPIPGIRMTYSSYSGYRLWYGDLCLTCHIK